MKYYVIIGYSRYIRKYEISEETYRQRMSQTDAMPSWKTFGIPTINGVIGIVRERVNFIEFLKEEAND